MAPRTTVLTLALLGSLAAGAPAQSRQMVSVQASGLLTTLSGSSFDQIGFGSGYGGEFQLRLNPSAFTIGAGFQITSHSGTVATFEDDQLTLTGFFVEPRYLIRIESRVIRPYLAGRLAFLRQKVSRGSGASAFEAKATATAIGGGGGFVARLTSNLNFDLGVALTSASFGNYEVGGVDINEPAGSGSSFVVKAGLNLGIGR